MELGLHRKELYRLFCLFTDHVLERLNLHPLCIMMNNTVFKSLEQYQGLWYHIEWPLYIISLKA